MRELRPQGGEGENTSNEQRPEAWRADVVRDFDRMGTLKAWAKIGRTLFECWLSVRLWRPAGRIGGTAEIALRAEIPNVGANVRPTPSLEPPSPSALRPPTFSAELGNAGPELGYHISCGGAWRCAGGWGAARHLALQCRPMGRRLPGPAEQTGGMMATPRGRDRQGLPVRPPRCDGFWRRRIGPTGFEVQH